MKKIIKFISCLTVLSLFFSVGSVFAAVENIKGVDYMEDVYRFDVEGVASVTNVKYNLILKLGILQSTDAGAFLKISDYKNAVEVLMGGTNIYAEEKGKVNLRTALKGLIEALGYPQELAKVSDNDAGIRTVASRIGLLKGIELKMTDYITNEQFADILFNALNAEIGYLPGLVISGPVSDNTPLGDIFNTVEIKGTVNAIEGINLYGTNAISKGFVQIDRTDYLIGDTAVENYLGCRIKGYARYSEDSGEFTLLHVEKEDEENSLVINFDDIVSFNSTRLTYTNAEGNEKSVNISGITSIVYNGKYMTGVNLSEVLSDADGRVELQSVTGNGSFEMAVVWTYRYYVVDTVDVDEEVIRLKYNALYNDENYIPIDTNARIRVFMNGGVFNWNELLTNNVIRVLSTYDGSYMEIDTSSSTLRGSVNETSEEDNTVIIGSNTYTISNDYHKCVKDTQSGLKKIEAGMQGTFYISSDDKIVGFKAGSQYSFGYLKNVIYDEDNEIYKIKYLSEDGEWRITKFSDYLIVDGKRMTAEDAGKYLVANKSDITENICRYKSNGVDMANQGDSLVFIDTMVDAAEEQTDTDRMRHCGSFEQYMNFRCIYLIGSNYQLSKDTVIFRVPDNLSKEDDFDVMMNTQLPWGDEDIKVPLELYNPNRYYLIGAAIYKGGEDAVGQEGFILIKNIFSAFDEEEEEIVYKVKGIYLNGAANEEREYIVTQDVAEKLASFKEGDIHRYAVNGDKISGIMDYFSSGWTLPEPKSIYRYHDYHYISGTVKDRDPENKLLVVDYGNSNIALTRIEKKVVVIDKTDGKPEVRVADYSAIQTGDKVFFYDIYAYSDWCVVLKE